MNYPYHAHYFGNTTYDLQLIAFGDRQCPADYTSAAEINTDFYVIHYLAYGKATFYKAGSAYPVDAGQCFLSRPGDVFRFSSDRGEPFHYVWLHIRGQTAHRIRELPYVVNADSTVFRNLIRCHTDSGNIELYSTAMLHLLLSQLLQSPRQENDYIAIIKNYVHTNYNADINVSALQKLVNLNRQYLSSLFHQRAGITLQQYILQTRMEKAKLLLSQGYSVSQTADLCGYANIYAFSKSFKKSEGISPSSYQKHRSGANE